jgi:LPS-assembly lipoprotein
MSSLSTLRRPLLRAGLIAVLGLGLSACFRPLYGPTASGVPLQDLLASIKIDTVKSPLGQERFGHFLRTELVYELNGSGQVHEKRFVLTLSIRELVQTPIVDTTLGRADAATIVTYTTFSLTSLDGTKVITGGTANASATYNRDPQRFASVRAARDAEMRAAKATAEQIRTRLSAVLSVAP